MAVAPSDSIPGCGQPSQVPAQLSKSFQCQPCAAIIAFETVPEADVPQYGIAHIEGEMPPEGASFRVLDLIEQPARHEAPSNLAAAALHFSPQILPALARTRSGKGGEIQRADAIGLLLQDGHRVLGVRLGEGDRGYDSGNFADCCGTFVDA